MVLLPQQGNPPLIVARRPRRENFISRCEAIITSIVIFVSVTTAKPTPICANPLVADVNPALCPQRMFHAASVKAPLPPGEGGTDEVDIIIDNLLAKLINQLKNHRSN